MDAEGCETEWPDVLAFDKDLPKSVLFSILRGVVWYLAVLSLCAVKAVE